MLLIIIALYIYREVFIDGDREILKNKIDFLQDKLKDLEKQKEEDKKMEIEKDRLIDDLQNKIKDLKSELENGKKELQEVDNIKREKKWTLVVEMYDNLRREPKWTIRVKILTASGESQFRNPG